MPPAFSSVAASFVRIRDARFRLHSAIEVARRNKYTSTRPFVSLHRLMARMLPIAEDATIRLVAHFSSASTSSVDAAANPPSKWDDVCEFLVLCALKPDVNPITGRRNARKLDERSTAKSRMTFRTRSKCTCDFLRARALLNCNSQNLLIWAYRTFRVIIRCIAAHLNIL